MIRPESDTRPTSHTHETFTTEIQGMYQLPVGMNCVSSHVSVCVCGAERCIVFVIFLKFEKLGSILDDHQYFDSRVGRGYEMNLVSEDFSN